MKKKGADKIISVYWFAILFIVAGAVVYMAALFYGAPYDVRAAEQRALENAIADCMTDKGYLNDNIFDANFKNNFLEECHLNFETEDVYGWNEQGQYYTKIDVNGFDVASETSGAAVFDFVAGNPNLEILVETEDEANSRSFYVVDKEGNSYVVKILAIVGKAEKNVA
jgi:hypothetical protein